MSPAGDEFFQTGNMTCGRLAGKYRVWRNDMEDAGCGVEGYNCHCVLDNGDRCFSFAPCIRHPLIESANRIFLFVMVMGFSANFFRRLYAAGVRFSTDDGPLVAAGVAYYVALSFFPLLLVLVAGLGIVLQWTAVGQDARVELIEAIRNQASPDLASEVDRALAAVSQRAPTGGPIGFVILVVSAIAIFTQLDAGFDRIWNKPIDRHSGWWAWVMDRVLERLKALLMLIGVGAFVLAVMVASMIWSTVRNAVTPAVEIAPWFDWATSVTINLVLNWIALSLIYRIVPKTTVPWLEAVRGGFLAAVLWEVGRQALSAYLLHLNYPSAYGIIGSFIAIMLWAYYATLVIFFGAEYVRVIGEERGK
jgi:membrane protein